MECSALTYQGLTELFYKIAETGIKGNEMQAMEAAAGKEEKFTEKSSNLSKKKKQIKCSLL
jgi:hypothetical protein